MVAAPVDPARIEQHHPSTNPGEDLIDFKGLDGRATGNNGIERAAKRGNVPLSVPEFWELPPDDFLGATANVAQKERFASRTVRSGSSTRRPSRIVSTSSSGSTFRMPAAPADLLMRGRRRHQEADPRLLPPALILRRSTAAVGNVDYQVDGEIARFLCVCLREVKGDARPDQLIAFARCFDEALPVDDRDLPAAALDQTGLLELPSSVRDRRPLNTQHFGEQVLSDRQGVIVAAIAHHEKPTREPLLEAVRTIARD